MTSPDAEATLDPHVHVWETSSWGVIVGVSRCLECGKVSERADFDAGLTDADFELPEPDHTPKPDESDV